MKTKILVLSTNRADFSHLRMILAELKSSTRLNCVFAAAGQHFDRERGYSYNEILSYGIKPDFSIRTPFDFSTESKSVSTLISFEKKLRTIVKMSKADYIMVLGDRIELLAVINLSLLTGTRIIHISGGETTEGAVDDEIRWMLSQIASVSFTGGELFRRNILNRFPDKKNVFNVGDPALEAVDSADLESCREEADALFKDFIKSKYALFTFHPETKSGIDVKKQFSGSASFLKGADMPVICTSPNNDSGGNYILSQLRHIERCNSNIKLVENLGGKLYLFLLKNASAAIGNSSSLLIEAPFLKVPSLVIGVRQKGRPLPSSALECGYSCGEIKSSLKHLLSDDFRKGMKNPVLTYEHRNTSSMIRLLLEEKIA